MVIIQLNSSLDWYHQNWKYELLRDHALCLCDPDGRAALALEAGRALGLLNLPKLERSTAREILAVLKQVCRNFLRYGTPVIFLGSPVGGSDRSQFIDAMSELLGCIELVEGDYYDEQLSAADTSPDSAVKADATAKPVSNRAAIAYEERIVEAARKVNAAQVGLGEFDDLMLVAPGKYLVVFKASNGLISVICVNAETLEAVLFDISQA